jgi:VWFA-related protein
MSSRIAAFTVSLALSLPLAGLPLLSSTQDKSAAQETPSSKSRSSRAINITIRAVVHDWRGRLVRNLKKEDFRILDENNREQEITAFRPGDSEPFSVGLLFDASMSRREEVLGAEGPAAIQFLKQVMRPQDRAFVAGFYGKPFLTAGPTADVDSLVEGVNEVMETRLEGGTAVYDTAIAACRGQMASLSGRKVLAIVTDMDDDSSRDTLDTAIKAAQRAGVAVWILELAILGPDSGKRAYLKQERLSDAFAGETGGETYTLRSRKDFQKAFDDLAAYLRDSYALEFVPDVARDGQFHRVHLEVKRTLMTVRAPKGYFSPLRDATK